MRPRLLACLTAGCLLIIVMLILLPRDEGNSGSQARGSSGLGPAGSFPALTAGMSARSLRSPAVFPAPSAEEIVAGKVVDFARDRTRILHAMAKHFHVQVPAEAERFFESAKSGNWEHVRQAFESLSALRKSEAGSEDLATLWPVILETYGVAEAAHDWPAQKLLDYGKDVLGSLRPGMVYVGGTDPGRFIPTLLNETSDGDRHIVLTQNALADNSYLKYIGFLYSDRLATLTPEDSSGVFQEYLANAQKRAAHDQESPNEEKQIRPGEDVRLIDGRVQVSGQMAVMAINEKLFQLLMKKNPDAAFAMEQSFPLASTYAEATPLGPIMELRVQDEQNALTQDRAAQAIDYWRATTQQLLSDPKAADSSEVRKAYSNMASEQAALFLDHKFSQQAEEGFRLSAELCPYSPEAVFRYVNLLLSQSRFEEAALVAENGAKADPDNSQFKDLFERVKALKSN
jgi:hypothetical protein